MIRLPDLETPTRLEDETDTPLGIFAPRYVRPVPLQPSDEIDRRIAAPAGRVGPAMPLNRNYVFDDTRRFPGQIALIDPVDRFEPTARYRHREAGVPLLGNNVGRRRSEDERMGLRTRVAKALLPRDAETQRPGRRARAVGCRRQPVKCRIEVEHLVDPEIYVLPGGEVVCESRVEIEPW